MSIGSIADIEKDLEYLWANFRCKPTYIQMTLEAFREKCRKYGAQPRAAKFLKDTASISGNAIVVLTPNKISLLTDDNGNLLEFN